MNNNQSVAFELSNKLTELYLDAMGRVKNDEEFASYLTQLARLKGRLERYAMGRSLVGRTGNPNWNKKPAR